MNIKGLIQKPLPFTFFNVTIGLLILNIGLFFLNILFEGRLTYYFAMHPLLLKQGFFWQPVTYMFMHANFSHLLFNMLGLFFFGIQLERRMGSWEYLLYYMVTGILTGIISIFFVGNSFLLGASGAIYGLLLAFATFFPDSRILLFFVLPLRAPIAVLLFAGISLFMQFTDRSAGGIAHFAHLAGLVVGFLYFIVRFRVNPLKIFFHK